MNSEVEQITLSTAWPCSTPVFFCSLASLVLLLPYIGVRGGSPFCTRKFAKLQVEVHKRVRGGSQDCTWRSVENLVYRSFSTANSYMEIREETQVAFKLFDQH
jgi:hypothetical protein